MMFLCIFIVSLTIIAFSLPAAADSVGQGLTSWYGYVVDASGNSYDSVTVTLHVMGQNSELYELTTASKDWQFAPFSGVFTFDNFTVDSARYAYVTASAEANGQTLSGRSADYQLSQGRTVTGTIVMQDTANASSIAVTGIVTDSFGTAYPMLPVTLHVMDSNGHELAEYTTTTSAYLPYVGSFVFSGIPAISGASYGYLTASAQLTDTLSINGTSANFNLYQGETSASSIILHIPTPDSISISVTPDPVLPGNTTSTLNAQLYLNGQPYKRSNYMVYFYTDNLSVVCPSGEDPSQGQWSYYYTDMNGSVSIPLTCHNGSAYVEVCTYQGWNMLVYNYMTVYVENYQGVTPVPGNPALVSDAGKFASFSGSLINSAGIGFGFRAVTLHVMNASGNEIYYMTRTTSSSQPFVGYFCFDDITVPYSGSYAYVTSNESGVYDNGSTYDFEGSSTVQPIVPGKTSTGSVVIPAIYGVPDEVRVTSSSYSMTPGGDTSVITAQLYCNGLPLNKAGYKITFTAQGYDSSWNSNTSVASLPSVNDNYTDADGQASIVLTSGSVPGNVYVSASVTSPDDGSLNLYGNTWLQSFYTGAISGIALDKNNAGIPNANVTLWNVWWNDTGGRWENSNVVSIPENPQLSGSGNRAHAGLFDFYYVPVGIYNVTVETSGHTSSAIVNVTQGTTTVLIKLADCANASDVAFNVPAASGSGTIFGIVTDQNKDSVPDANVTLWDCSYNAANGQWVQADIAGVADNPQLSDGSLQAGEGAYTFNNVAAGTYIVTVEKEGHDYYAVVNTTAGGLTYGFVTIPFYSYISPVAGSLQAGFTSNVTSGEAPLAVQFNDTSAGGPVSWQWSFGDNSSNASAQNVSHTFQSPGNYTVTLTVSNGTQSSTAAGQITVVAAPGTVPDALRVTAEYDTILEGGQPDWVIAQLYSNGAPLRKAGYEVAFSSDNDTVANLPSVRTNYTDAGGQAWILLTSNTTIGKVNVTGIVNAGGVSLSDTTTVRNIGWGTVTGIVSDMVGDGVPDANVALWHVQWNDMTGRWENVAPAGVPDNPQLSGDNASGHAYSFTFSRVPWDVYNLTAEKDGHVYWALILLGPWPADVLAYADATYIPPDEYGTVAHNIAMPDYVYRSPEAAPLQAGFTSNVTIGPAPLAVRFTDTSSGDGISGWQWSFGDNSSNASGQSAVHTFQSPGNYTVTLTVSNGLQSSTAAGQITVVAAPGPGTVPDALRVTAQYNAILAGGQADLVTAQLYSNGAPLRKAGYEVVFSSDNDTVANLPPVRASYTDAGGQAWILLTSNMTFGKVNVTGIVSVSGNVNLSDTVTVRNIAWGTVSGLALDRNGAGIPDANVTLWNVRWNDTANTWENTHMAYICNNPALSNGGVTGPAGLFAFSRVPWDVYNLTVEKDGHVGEAIILLGQWPSGVQAYANATYIPPCEYGTVTRNVVLADYTYAGPAGGRPLAGFTSNVTSGAAPLTIRFYDTSAGGPTAWQWSFGDGSANSTVQNATHTYDSPGTYTVTLTASNANGSDTVQKMGYVTVLSAGAPELYLSGYAPSTIYQGSEMEYGVYYYNAGSGNACQAVLADQLPEGVDFVSATDGGVYYPANNTVVWAIGTIGARGSDGWYGEQSICVDVHDGVPAGTDLRNNVSLHAAGGYALDARADTSVIASSLPQDVGMGPINYIYDSVPSVYWNDNVTFTYHGDTNVTGVDIGIHVSDGGQDIVASMAGGPPVWSYGLTLYPRHGSTTVNYTVHYANATNLSVGFSIYIDPAGYVYDTSTGKRIAGASVWLQQPDGSGGWVNVSTGLSPPTMVPDMNPLVTGADGQFQWNTLNGSYRVHVEAAGYDPADSIVVSVPPPVLDLNVGLTPNNHTSFTLSLKQGWNLVSSPLVVDPGLNVSTFIGTSVTMVARYNRTASGFDIYRVGKTPVAFQFEAGQGYFLYCNNGMTYTINGYSEPGQSVTIGPGWNLIGWTNMTASNSRSLAAGLHNVTMMARYNTTAGSYDIYRVGKTPTPFGIVPGEGYFLYTTHAGQQILIMG